jgi:hypothetical protein
MSVEQHTLPGISLLVNTFYVSLLVLWKAVSFWNGPLRTVSFPARSRSDRKLSSLSFCHSDRSRSDSDGGVEEPASRLRRAASPTRT